MKYATVSQLIDRFDAGELARIAVPKEHVSIDAALLKLTIAGMDRSMYPADEQTAADAALVKINQVINDASGEIDAHLESKYQLPLSTVPLKLEQVCCDIARYALYDDQPTEHITKRYDDAVKYLLNVSKGVISLGVDKDNETPAEQDNVVDFTEGSNVFDRDISRSFI